MKKTFENTEHKIDFKRGLAVLRFDVPLEIRERLDDIGKKTGLTMTAVIKTLINQAWEQECGNKQNKGN